MQFAIFELESEPGAGSQILAPSEIHQPSDVKPMIENASIRRQKQPVSVEILAQTQFIKVENQYQRS
jgi:hypothetical protein